MAFVIAIVLLVIGVGGWLFGMSRPYPSDHALKATAWLFWYTVAAAIVAASHWFALVW